MSESNTDKQINAATKEGFAVGISIVAAALLFVAGIVAIFQGISAVNNDNLLVFTEDYIFEFNLTSWGWIHIVLGIIAVIVAGGLVVGSDWGRVAAILIASLSIIAQFLWLPYYPVWAIIIIILDIIVIWAVASWKPRADGL
ncbi:hypothetical protein GYA93_08410 [Gordonia desulfuricans]|uniref:DUF7144 domain-containing protein n=1 Tax=Gordonia desulfuricans TaxID=89051 RepID=A0A7K3LN38_9ACTN|nr:MULTISPECIES: hypothetical protein [Gordonia]EMP10878.2 membrane protein [Gordonia sp. NB41Y]NDK89598.1 hypothetical protein [Gordonia desulfuricans]WLP92574.1 hypothetical protein Q9K23_10270 [Gordonia sp. NB41Y]